MNETDYNDLLYEKAQKEYDDLIAELKELPSEQVIERAYEKVIKENILCILEDSQRDQKEAKALYLEKYPLDRAYQDWLKSDVSETAMLRDLCPPRKNRHKNQVKNRMKRMAKMISKVAECDRIYSTVRLTTSL